MNTWHPKHRVESPTGEQYTLWSYTDSDGRKVFNVTPGYPGKPPEGSGGYFDAYALLRLKGLTYSIPRGR